MDEAIRVVIEPDHYASGVLPLPGWPDGSHELKLDDGTRHEIICSGARTSSLDLWVWDRLRPGMMIEVSSFPSNGRPGWVRVPPATPARARPSREAADSQEAAPPMLDLVETALDWMGSPARFEQIWAFLHHRGVGISPVEILATISTRFAIDESGLVQPEHSLSPIETHARVGWEPARWDNVESAYWELNPPTGLPLSDRVFRKKRKSFFDGLEYHIDEMRHPLLTAAEERDLGETISQGLAAERALRRGVDDWDDRYRLGMAIRKSDRAREQFALRNLRLVVNNARRYAPRINKSSLDLGDLIQAGYLGLLRAVIKFDPRRGTKFSTYATWWIRQAMQREFATTARTIRLPVHVFDELNRFVQQARRVWDAFGSDLPPAVLADRLDIDVDKVVQLQSLLRQPTPIHVMDPDDPRLAFPADTDEEAMRRILTEYVNAALNQITERERSIIVNRFGLDGRPPQTLEQIGQRFGVTRERIRQLEKQGLAELRKALHMQSLLPPTTTPPDDPGDEAPDRHQTNNGE